LEDRVAEVEESIRRESWSLRAFQSIAFRDVFVAKQADKSAE